MATNRLQDLSSLEERLSRPDAALVDFVATLEGPLLVLGAGGKMGPSLCVQAKRAADAAGKPLNVLAVSRFSDAALPASLAAKGVTPITCDLSDPAAVAALPDASNIIYLVGVKFGTAGNPSLTWHCHTVVPALVAARYPGSRMVALSTGNVYPFVPVASGGAREDTPLEPVGEYAQSCLARERIFSYYADEKRISMVLMRLNYAVELRYGVLVDLARRIHAGQPVDLRMGYFNCIWQADANSAIIRSLDLATVPAAPLNLTGLETLSVQTLAQELAERMEKPVVFSGRPAPTALLSNASSIHEKLNLMPTPLDTVLDWTAEWIKAGQPVWQKPTHFEVRDGAF